MVARPLAASLLSLTVVSCASGSEFPGSPLVVVFGVEATRAAKLQPEQLRAIEDGIGQILDRVRAWRVVLRGSLDQAIANSRRKVRGRSSPLRTCLEASCQVKVGRALAASRALAMRVEQNLLGQCDLYLAIYDLKRSGRDLRAHVRSGCGDRALQLSASRALCQALREDAAVEGELLDSTDCLAGAELVWLEERIGAIRRARATGPDGMVALERRLAEETLSLRRAYDRVIGLGPRRWAVSAVCRQGAIYEAFASALSASAAAAEPPPAIRRQGAMAVSSYRTEIHKTIEAKVTPLRAQAEQLYASCLKQAAELGLTTPFIEAARKRRGRR